MSALGGGVCLVQGGWMGLPVPGGCLLPEGGVCSRGVGIPACTEADPLRVATF